MKIIFWALIGYILYRWLLGNRLPTGRRGAAHDGMGPSRPEGEIRVDRQAPEKKSRFADEGDFVDYEEVD